ncbi:Spy/CpxP family protein refolding chaperone [Rhodoblastus sphagnicola]|uniref:hypothetical protein n=1 Tax=Rhodoblastus sphagnicola TaxID=333368 RepID=UPI001304862C|nr:hypothetical protein [Rhodoblastus sphagnicola]MBB4196449.1 Spy/CpxP family protein refolding chaperone [Rhodoblastus sphagnicola]
MLKKLLAAALVVTSLGFVTAAPAEAGWSHHRHWGHHHAVRPHRHWRHHRHW